MNTKTNQKKVLSTELFTGLFGHQKLTKKFMLSQTPTVPSDHQLKKKKTWARESLEIATESQLDGDH